MMKSCLLVLAVLLNVGFLMSQEPTPEQLKMYADCIKDSSVKPEDLAKMVLNETAKDIPTKMFCYLKCVAEKMEIIKANGEVNIEKATEVNYPPGSPDADKDTFIKCLKEKPLVKTCTDLKKFMDCAPAGTKIL